MNHTSNYNTYTNTTGYVNPTINSTGYVHPTGYNNNIHQNQGYNQTIIPPSTTVTVTTGTYTIKPVLTKGEKHGWRNPNGIAIPLIAFEPTCKKCHGSGVGRGVGTTLQGLKEFPCTRCYTRQGYCKKCYGSGINYKKNVACTRCKNG